MKKSDRNKQFEYGIGTFDMMIKDFPVHLNRFMLHSKSEAVRNGKFDDEIYENTYYDTQL